MIPGDADEFASSASPGSFRLLSSSFNSFERQIRPVFFLVFVFLINFTSRVVLSPLLPAIEEELGVGHARVGLLTDFWLCAVVLLQPLLAVWFFPAAFAAVAMITSSRARNVAVSLSVPFGFIIGGGVIPVFIGYTGDAGSFAVGIVFTGAVIAGGGVLALLLKLTENGAPSP